MIDYKQTADCDIDLSAGDLLLVEPTKQHQSDIIIAGQGHNKETPHIGVDSILFMHDTDPAHYLRTIRKHFTRDGMTVRAIYLDAHGEVNTDAGYENS